MRCCDLESIDTGLLEDIYISKYVGRHKGIEEIKQWLCFGVRCSWKGMKEAVLVKEIGVDNTY